MAGMDVLCCDKTGTLTLNKLTVDENMINFHGALMLMYKLFDLKARAGIEEVHFLPFNPKASDQLAIAKETGRQLGMGANMYPSTSLLGEHKDGSISTLPIDELIEKADSFAGVFPGWYSHNFVAFTSDNDFSREAREAAWATQQRSLHVNVLS
ncbi:hypothetical protein Syun_009517 [Stephania yunnanensis]|uniref:Uncharacterized protein n=1 Tax=Stephania yunnanensis TaxID=152371 RepID=A0AAP0PNM0_9MAGN